MYAHKETETPEWTCSKTREQAERAICSARYEGEKTN